MIIPWKKITRGLPRGKRYAYDRAPTIDEICKIIEYPDRRIKPIAYTMTSSGIRVGDWDHLKWTHVRPIMKNGKLLLKFATASVIESLRRNPELDNFVSYNTSNNNYTTHYGSNCLSLISGEHSFSYISDDIYTAVILEEAEKLYNKLTTKLTNEIIAATSIMVSSLPLLPNNNSQKLIHCNDNAYDETKRIEIS